MTNEELEKQVVKAIKEGDFVGAEEYNSQITAITPPESAVEQANRLAGKYDHPQVVFLPGETYTKVNGRTYMKVNCAGGGSFARDVTRPQRDPSAIPTPTRGEMYSASAIHTARCKEEAMKGTSLTYDGHPQFSLAMGLAKYWAPMGGHDTPKWIKKMFGRSIIKKTRLGRFASWIGRVLKKLFGRKTHK